MTTIRTAPAHLSSMTGYARSSGQTGAATWTWEIRTVNARGVELRLRLPAGLDGLDAAVRARVSARIRRGTVHLGLTLLRPRPEQTVRVDRAKLAALVSAVSEIALPSSIGAATLDGILALPGVIEVSDRIDAPAEDLEAALLDGLDVALDGLATMRSGEGSALGRVLGERLVAVARLVAEAEATPGRRPDAVRERLARRVADLSGAVPSLDLVRLHQEAVLMAAKADVHEELDRLAMHGAAASALLAEGGAIGRRLDFLAQELGREAGTLCAKSNDGALTLVGLDLRTEIEQFREQVQNLE